MPRMGRLHVDGGCYHVLGRGFERRNIFKAEADKQDFVNRLARSLKTTEIRCYAWCVMPNHYHLLLKVGKKPLSDLMRKLLSGFATAYNRRHNRAGYVFQNRFKSILCDEDEYLLQLVRYIHLNPVKSGLVANIDELDHYQWTGHAALMGHQFLDWLNTDEVLSHFAASVKNARNRYRSFLDNADTSADLEGGGLIRSYTCWEETSSVRREHELQIGDERILGSSTFVQRVLESDEITSSSAYRAKLRGWSLEKLVTTVCAYYKIERKELYVPCRKGSISKTKGVIIYFAMEELGIPSQKLAENLGLTRSGVYAAKARGKVLVEKRNLTLEKL